MHTQPEDHEKASREAARKSREVRQEIATKSDVGRLERRVDQAMRERRSFRD